MKDHPALTPRTEEIFGATINGARMSTRQGHTKEAILDWIDEHRGIPKEKPVATPPLLLEDFRSWIEALMVRAREQRRHTKEQDLLWVLSAIDSFKNFPKDSTKS